MRRVKKVMEKVVNAIGYDIQVCRAKNDIELYYRIYGKKAVEDRRFYNIGAGSFRHPAWTNVDHKSEWYKDVQSNNIDIDWDLLSLTPVPVEDSSAEIVYSSHTTEHITDEGAQNMFNESHRILREGGVFRVTTPNIDLDFRAYKGNDRHFFYWIDWYSTPKECQRIKLNKPLNEATIQQIFLWHFASSASTLHADGSPKRITDEELDRIFREMEYQEALNYCISKCSLEVQKKYPGNHINWWNKNKLLRMLRNAGFDDICLSGYGQSVSPVLRNILIFDNTHPKISLYVEAVK
jgi:SAM-dependent methyltransferase